VMIPVMYVLPMEAHREESLYGMAPITISDRGEGALGSSEKQELPSFEKQEAALSS